MKTNPLFWLCIWGLTGLASCADSESAESSSREKKTEKALKPAYQLGTVARQSLGNELQLPAEFRAFQEVSIFPKADGFVEKVLVDRGSPVRRGQVLMVLSAPETEEKLVAARSAMLKAEALLVASREHYRRLKASNRIPGSVSALDLETAQARMRADSASLLGEQASLRALTKLRDYLTVRAPFDGYITERNVHPGALVGSGNRMERPMLVLQQQNRLRLVVDLPEAVSVRMREGQAVTFAVAALPGKEFKGTIARRSGSMNQRFRSETVEIDVANGSRRLRPGMFAEVLLSTGEIPESLVVPATAVITSTEKQYVIAVREGLTRHVEVRTGQQSGGLMEVYGALKAGDSLVLNAREELREGVAIR